MSDIVKIIDAYDRIRNKGWAPGGTCAIALLCHITDNSKKIYVTAENIKEQLTPNDLFLLRDLYGIQDIQSPLNQADKGLKISQWSPILLEILGCHAEATAVFHLFPTWTTLAAKYVLDAWARKGESHPNILRITHWKIIEKLNVSTNELLIPILELESIDKLHENAKEMLKLYPQTCILIIRDYGIFVWGATLADAFNRAEIVEHLSKLQIYENTLLGKIDML